MSLAVPTSFKRGNIVENWVVLLGYDSAFDSTTSANQLAEGLDNTETGIDVDNGGRFTVGDYIKINDEPMLIQSISSNTLTVQRNLASTSGYGDTHNNNDQIYFNNYLPVSFSDTEIDGRFSHGYIKNAPSIRESISLRLAQSKTGNFSITLINGNYKGNPLSEELYGGDRAYINRTCRVYIQPDNKQELTSSLLVYTGRLYNL